MLPRSKMANQLRLKDANVVKIAVQFASYPAQLIEFDQKQPLENIIRNLCNYPDWGITEPNDYALQFIESISIKYVTETNRENIKDGIILVLTHSPAKVAKDIYTVLNSDKGPAGKKMWYLKTLSTVAKDLTFATEFININGLNLILRYILNVAISGEFLSLLLLSLIELMEHGTVPWKIIESTICTRILFLINNSINTPKLHDSTVIAPALTILDNIVENGTEFLAIENISMDTLMVMLEVNTEHEEVQQNVMALINSLFKVGSDHRQRQIAKRFQSEKFRNVLEKSVLTSKMGNELRYQLYVFQQLMLNLYKKRMMTPVSDNDNSKIEKIRELKRIAFDGDCTDHIHSLKRMHQTKTKQKNRLGFKCELNIVDSFKRTPPGLLLLDCLMYFAQNYTVTYKIMVHQLNSISNDYEFPLGEASIEMVYLLGKLLRIGEPPTELGAKFLPILYSHDQPFFELFSVCIESLNQTWRDMKASYKDLQTVFLVAKEQIERTLDCEPINFIEFRRIIKTFSYTKISLLRTQEQALIAEYESSATAIIKLKEKLTPDVLKLIRNQRLNYLVNGSIFHQYGKNGQRLKDKFWCVRVSKNHRTLHHGECDGSIKCVEELSNEILVKHIRDVEQGKNCKRKGLSKLIFGINYVDQSSLQPCDPLEFVAMDELTQNYWVDGLSALLNLEMPSSQKNEDLDVLLSMEIKIRLLDAKGFVIEKEAPKIPDDPEDYNF